MKREPTEARQRALERKLGDYVVYFMVVIGLWLLFAPLAPDILGYSKLAQFLGGTDAITRFFTAFLFLYFAGIVKEKNALRYKLEGMMEIIRSHLPAHRIAKAAPAVEVLLRALRSEKPDIAEKARHGLREISGRDLGPNPAVWETWWEQQRQGAREGEVEG